VEQIANQIELRASHQLPLKKFEASPLPHRDQQPPQNEMVPSFTEVLARQKHLSLTELIPIHVCVTYN
jgi:hypothetical protein